MTTTTDVVLADYADSVLTLTINRENARNALNDEVIEALTFHIRGVDRDARAIVITGAGNKAFCAGADLKSSSKTFDFDHSVPTTKYADLLRAGHASNTPIIARVNGHCLAGGMGLLAMADLAVAASHAKFGLPEVKIGMFAMQVASLLMQIVPKRRFVELCLMGEQLSASQAMEAGLLNAVVPAEELDGAVSDLLSRLRANSPTAIRRGKHALRAIEDMTFEQSIAYTESQIASLPFTEDAREGILAFNDKRKPVWSGR